jgi:hypothetical protein
LTSANNASLVEPKAEKSSIALHRVVEGSLRVEKFDQTRLAGPVRIFHRDQQVEVPFNRLLNALVNRDWRRLLKLRGDRIIYNDR